MEIMIKPKNNNQTIKMGGDGDIYPNNSFSQKFAFLCKISTFSKKFPGSAFPAPLLQNRTLKKKLLKKTDYGTDMWT